MESRLLHHHHHQNLFFFPLRLCNTSNPRRHGELRPFFPSNFSSPVHLQHHHSPSLKPLLSSPSSASSSSKDDLAPIPHSRRNFTAFDIASLWISLVVGIPSYYLAGSLVDLGMSWWQGIATVSFSNLLLLLPLTLSAFPGTRHGLPFPILARSTFGPRGSFLPSLFRSLVACGWFSIESWIGGRALLLLLLPLSHPPLPLQFASFLFFCLAQIALIWPGMNAIRKLEIYSAPILILLTSSLLFWSVSSSGGFGPMLSLTSRLSPSEFWPLFFPALNANISFWATVALNIPDFSRYARSQRDQILGQIGLPVFMGLFTFVGLAVTSSTQLILGRLISDPIHLLAEIPGGPLIKLIAIIGVSLATITTNIAANMVAPANALINFNPSVFNFRRGAIVMAVIGLLFQPWKLLGSSESFVYTWLLGSSALIGPIGGIMIVDYYLVKGMELDVEELYKEDGKGKYYYWRGYNLVAMAALVAGVLPVLPGFLKKVGILSYTSGFFVGLYNNAWFVSFFLAGFVYWGLSFFLGRKKRD
ncbi:purine-uracil permease NCS1 [Phalaenopsis equestris]|uniref:purine-uracil permease NCS1 n=1 Tax=Phalaenopsis equestris TaxID=78828 RepID=UPI0009E36269|nr:purine-uracil permease NCS1 [Phalaenopsis equestris]